MALDYGALDYGALQRESSKLFELIREEKDILRKANITFSTYISEESRRQLADCALKIGVKVRPDKLADGAGALVALVFAHPVLAVVGAAVAGGAAAADAYQRKKAEEEAKRILERAFMELSVNLGKIDNLLDQKTAELGRVSACNSVRRKELAAEISAMSRKMSEIQSFKECVTVRNYV